MGRCEVKEGSSVSTRLARIVSALAVCVAICVAAPVAGASRPVASANHLVDGDVIPRSYIDFLNHHSSWEVLHARWKQEHVAYNWHSAVGFPKAPTDLS